MPNIPPELKEQLYRLHARMCRALASEKRIEILDHLQEGEKRVDVLAKLLDTTAANTSQHLSVLKEAGIVCSRREKRFVYYSICDQRMVKACNLMREAMLERLRDEKETHRKLVDLADQDII